MIGALIAGAIAVYLTAWITYWVHCELEDRREK